MVKRLIIKFYIYEEENMYTLYDTHLEKTRKSKQKNHCKLFYPESLKVY